MHASPSFTSERTTDHVLERCASIAPLMSSDAALQSDAELQLFYKVANAQILGFPYPHIYIPDIFPADFYSVAAAEHAGSEGDDPDRAGAAGARLQGTLRP